MKKCRDKHCKVSHCLSSRCVLNHYRICKSEGKTASCAICAPVMKHIRQNGDGNGSSSPGDTGDDLDTLSDGLDSSDPLDGTAMIGGPNCDVDGVNMIGGQVGGVAQLTGMEPMDAFTMEERAGSTSLSPNPAGIPQAIGLPQAPAQQEQQQQLPNNNGMQQAQAVAAAAAMGMAGMPGMPPQGQQPPMNSNASVPELQQELQKKQLLLQQVQQQKVRFDISFINFVRLSAMQKFSLFAHSSFSIRPISMARVRNCNSSSCPHQTHNKRSSYKSSRPFSSS